METLCNTITTTSKFETLVNTIYTNRNQPVRNKNSITNLIQWYFNKTSKKRHPWKRETFKDLLLHLYQKKCYRLVRTDYYVKVLHHMSLYGNQLVRPITDWQPQSILPEEQIHELIRHCFARYQVPIFLESAFRLNHKTYMNWYIQLGKGKSVTQLKGMPIQLTKKMAHEFRHVPNYLSISQGLRFVQAKGLGASNNRANDIAQTILARNGFEDEAFWTTVIQFLVKLPKFEHGQVDHVLDYIAAQRHENEQFSMKGRSFAALLRLSDAWHREMYMKRRQEDFLEWNSCGIKPFHKEITLKGAPVTYSIVELCNSEALLEEGYHMQHCVGTYDSQCYTGRSSIFSLRRSVKGEEMIRMATIEVGLEDREIVQVQGQDNSYAGDLAHSLIEQWEQKWNEGCKKMAMTAPIETEEPVVQQAFEIGYGQEVLLYESQEPDNNAWVNFICALLGIAYAAFYIYSKTR